MNTVFYNETGLNGKFQVMSALELSIAGQIRTTAIPNMIHTHKCQIFKNLHNYWVDKKGLELVRQMENSERTYF